MGMGGLATMLCGLPESDSGPGVKGFSRLSLSPGASSLLPPLLYVNTTSTLTDTVLVTFWVAVVNTRQKQLKGERKD